MKKRTIWVTGTVAVFLSAFLQGQDAPREQDWTNYVRIGAYGLSSENAQQIVDRATKDGVSGIEVDNDIPGRYESFLDPQQKLAAIRAVAAAAHKAGNHAFVYIAGLECITANAEHTQHTLAKDHPDWLQRKITGEPAIFGSGNAFWIAPGDEDVWVSPFAPEWRKTYMERVRQIAATGIDGIYVDIPYWMTHFDGWEDTWASFDDYTVAAFLAKTGLNARKDLKLGNFSDPNFRKWVDFRIQSLTDFMQEIDRNAKSVNPKSVTIAEIYPGIEEEAVRVGADVYQMYAVLGGIAHEYEFGEGDHMASSRSPLDWFEYQVGMASFRAFAQGKPTWILNYSWDGDKKVDPGQSMENLAMSQLMAGANFWDARGHVMSGSNDPATRQHVFRWIADHQDLFYKPRHPLHPIGVYFSPSTRNYFAKDFIPSYRGVLILLMQKHLEYQVVTPRNLASFRGETLVLPDVRMLDDVEKSALRSYVAAGNTLVINGTDVSGFPDSPNVVHFRDDPGKAYMMTLEHDFEHATTDSQKSFLATLKNSSEISVEAPPEVVTNIAEVDGKECVFIANFAGLRGHENPVQNPVNVRISFSGRGKQAVSFLPFLGETREIHAEQQAGNSMFTLPAIEKGGVACAQEH
ncbi:MAG: hypothetical protein WB421_06150 [Terriglobales bacterium]